MHFVHGVANFRTRGLAADLLDDIFELLSIFASFDGIDIGTDQFNTVLVEDSRAIQLDCCVQGSLSTERC